MLPAGLKLLRRLVPPPTRPLASAYDYVIVGAGSAGCMLANELSKDESASVLLIEAGGWDANPLIHIPAESSCRVVKWSVGPHRSTRWSTCAATR